MPAGTTTDTTVQQGTTGVQQTGYIQPANGQVIMNQPYTTTGRRGLFRRY
jgi:hypothetical protein